MNARATVRFSAPLRRVWLCAPNGLRESQRETIAPPPAAVPAGPPPEAILAEALESVRESLADLEVRRKQSLAELQEAAIELALAAAEQAVRQAIAADQIDVSRLVGELVSRFRLDQPVRVLLHPDDLRLLSAGQGNSSPWPAELVELAADPGIPRGSGRAAAGHRVLTTDWRTHLQEMRAAMLEELEHAQIERRGAEGSDHGFKRYPDRRETA
ncbi:MAG: hypothetical protein KF774_20015 [Planctomyces sp.]|nr:hypothetical protein [Planctomyces sp.]